MWKPLLGVSAFALFIGFAIRGPSVFEGAAMIWFADLEAVLWDSIYSEWIAIPSLFLILVGFGIGFYVLPAFLRWRHKPEELEKFHTRFREIGPTKSTFYKNLTRAYVKWRARQQDAPSDLNLLLQDTAYPDWVPVGRKANLYDVAVSNARVDAPLAFRFAVDLYREIEACKQQAGTSTTLLSNEDCLEFDGARQALAYLWSDLGRAIFRDHKFRFKDVKDLLAYDERMLKALTYLEISLFIHLHQIGEGDQSLFKLGHRYFYPLIPSFKKYRIPRVLSKSGA